MKGGATAPRPRALLLDLDGTLVDSAPDIADALNRTLAGLGRAPLPEARVRTMIGNGLATLVRAALEATGEPPAPDLLARAGADMARQYGARLTARTRLLPGAADLLHTCRALGIATACVTNKPGAMARAILAHFGLLDHLALVIGGDGDMPRKPAPDGLVAALAALRVTRGEAWMIGDGLPDALAARAAGIRMVAVRSDYGEAASDGDIAGQFLDDLNQLVAILRELELRA